MICRIEIGAVQVYKYSIKNNEFSFIKYHNQNKDMKSTIQINNNTLNFFVALSFISLYYVLSSCCSKKEVCLHKEQTCGCQGGEGWGSVGVGG